MDVKQTHVHAAPLRPETQREDDSVRVWCTRADTMESVGKQEENHIKHEVCRRLVRSQTGKA